MPGTEFTPGTPNIPEVLTQGEFAMVAENAGFYAPFPTLVQGQVTGGKYPSWGFSQGILEAMGSEINELRGQATRMAVVERATPNRIVEVTEPGLTLLDERLKHVSDTIRSRGTLEPGHVSVELTAQNWRNFLGPLVLQRAMCLYAPSNDQAAEQRARLSASAYEQSIVQLPKMMAYYQHLMPEQLDTASPDTLNAMGTFAGMLHERTVLALLNFERSDYGELGQDAIALPALPSDEPMGIDGTLVTYENGAPMARYAQSKRGNVTGSSASNRTRNKLRRRYPFQAIITSADVGNDLDVTENSDPAAGWETTHALAQAASGKETDTDKAQIEQHAPQVKQVMRHMAQSFEITP